VEAQAESADGEMYRTVTITGTSASAQTADVIVTQKLQQPASRPKQHSRRPATTPARRQMDVQTDEAEPDPDDV
jgi:hypothetical protein